MKPRSARADAAGPPSAPAEGFRLAWLVWVVAIAAGIGIYWYAHRDLGELERTRRAGLEVVAALDAYRGDRGEYPERLERLVPEHLPELEPPPWGVGRWVYRRYRAGAAPGDTAVGDDAGADSAAWLFQLSVPENESGYPVLYWDPVDGGWVLNN